MKWRQTSNGFTLIEVILVFAIASLLAASYIASQGGLRSNTSFTGSMDQLRNQLAGIQNEANHAVSDDRNRVGSGATDLVVFGKLVEFSTASRNQMHVYTLIGSSTNLNSSQLVACDSGTRALQNGLQYTDSADKAVIFQGRPDHMYTAPSGYNLTAVPAGLTVLPGGSCSAAIAAYSPSGSPGPSPSPSPGPSPGPPPPPPPIPFCPSGYTLGVAPEDTSLCYNHTPVNGLMGHYYANVNLSGSPVTTAVDTNISLGGIGDPSFLTTLQTRTGIVPANVSVSWTGQINLQPSSARYRICTESDDGTTLLINGVSQTPDSMGLGHSASVNCSGQITESGWRDITINYSNIIWNGGPADAKFSLFWRRSDGTNVGIGAGEIRTFLNPVTPTYGLAPHNRPGTGWQTVLGQISKAISELIVGHAYAAASVYLLDPNNYVASNTSYTSDLILNFDDQGSHTGTIKLSPSSNTISRTAN